MTGQGIAGHFERTCASYDAWYDEHPALYRTELAALRKAVPARGRGLEIGVGTGRFAGPLSVRYGLDPAPGMLEMARGRGIRVVRGVGEALPFRSGCFDLVLIVFVIEFVDDLEGFLSEAARVLKPRGRLVIGLIDKDSAWGRHFHRTSRARRFFHPPSPRELFAGLGRVGLRAETTWQTLFSAPPDLERVECPRPGFGRGGFFVVRAVKGRGAAAASATAVVKRGRKT